VSSAIRKSSDKHALELENVSQGNSYSTEGTGQREKKGEETMSSVKREGYQV
jgi:hypothetical protein